MFDFSDDYIFRKSFYKWLTSRDIKSFRVWGSIN